MIEALYDQYLEMKSKDAESNSKVSSQAPLNPLYNFNTGFNYSIHIRESGKAIISDKRYGDFVFINIEDAYQYYKTIGEDCGDLESLVISHELFEYLKPFDLVHSNRIRGYKPLKH